MGDNSKPENLAEVFTAGVHSKDDTASILKSLEESLTKEMQEEYALLEKLCDYCKPSKAEEEDKGKEDKGEDKEEDDDKGEEDKEEEKGEDEEGEEEE